MKTWMGIVGIWLWWAAIVDASHNEDILNLIKDVRKHVIDVSKDTRYGIPVLPDPSTTQEDDEKYLEIEIPNKIKESIRIGIDITSLSMIGYKSNNDSYFFKDPPTSAFNYLFTATSKIRLSYGGSYPELEDAAQQFLQYIDLGIPQLDQAVTLLSQSNVIKVDQARSLIVINQVILEAIKLRFVEHLVQRSIVYEQSFRPNPAVLSLEEKWSNLSDAIQQSNQGIFSESVELMRSDDSIFNVDTVTGIIVSNLALMLYVCKEDQAALLIRPVVAAKTCQVPEPTVHMVGENNECVTVGSSGFRPLLTDCSSLGTSKLWKFRKNKTIQYASNDVDDSCVANNKSSGDDLSLDDCDSASRIVNWNLKGDGSIVTPGFQRAWDARNGYPFVTLYDVSYSTSQSWLATRYSTPFSTTIYAQGLETCMGTDEWGNISLTTGQKWLIFSDGSIRPEINNSSCITCLGDEERSLLAVRLCTRGSTTQRWAFQNNGSIKNLKNGFVINVRYDLLFFISKDEGDVSQQWLPLI